jgi:hypothetical protein
MTTEAALIFGNELLIQDAGLSSVVSLKLNVGLLTSSPPEISLAPHFKKGQAQICPKKIPFEGIRLRVILT